ncbi:MAG: hypothetical protein ACK5QN_03285 [Burkholderiales bacterium]
MEKVSAIERAVQPLREIARAQARQRATCLIERKLSELQSVAWDLRRVAPSPHANMTRSEYRQAERLRQVFKQLTAPSQAQEIVVHYARKTPEIRIQSPQAERLFIEQMIEGADIAYRLYVEKLCKKVGEVESAELQMHSDIWDCSYLYVVAGGEKQIWKTQVITNISSLGKPFYQWPTRRLKSGQA